MLKVKIDNGATEIDKIGHHIITYKDGSQIEYAPKKVSEKRTFHTFETDLGRPRALYRLLSGSRNILSLQPVSFNHPAAPYEFRISDENHDWQKKEDCMLEFEPASKDTGSTCNNSNNNAKFQHTSFFGY